MNPKRIYNSSNDELLQIIRNQRRKINQRLRQLESTKGGTNAPAYRSAKKHGLTKRKKAYKLNTGDSMVDEASRATAEQEAELNENWLKNKTSTKKGWEETREKLLDTIGEDSISNRVENRLWDVYNQMIDEYPSQYYRKGKKRNNSDQLIKEIWDEIRKDKRIGVEKIAEIVRERLKDEYEKEQEILQKEESLQTSSFFKSVY